jgi:hypothetical protein
MTTFFFFYDSFLFPVGLFDIVKFTYLVGIYELYLTSFIHTALCITLLTLLLEE